MRININKIQPKSLYKTKLGRTNSLVYLRFMYLSFCLFSLCRCTWELDAPIPPSLDLNITSANIISFSESTSNNSIAINCGDNKIISCQAASDRLTFVIKGTSNNVQSDGTYQRGYINIFLRPIVNNVKGNWFTQGIEENDVSPTGNGKWEKTINYGATGFEPQQGDKLEIIGIITVAPITKDQFPANDVFPQESILGMQFKEFCRINLTISKPCYDSNAVSSFKINQIDRTSGTTIQKRCLQSPCIITVDGELVGLRDSECDGKLYIQALVEPSAQSPPKFFLQNSESLASVNHGGWTVQAQLGGPIPSNGEKFTISVIASLVDYEQTRFNCGNKMQIDSIVEADDAIVTSNKITIEIIP